MERATEYKSVLNCNETSIKWMFWTVRLLPTKITATIYKACLKLIQTFNTVTLILKRNKSRIDTMDKKFLRRAKTRINRTRNEIFTEIRIQDILTDLAEQN